MINSETCRVIISFSLTLGVRQALALISWVTDGRQFVILYLQPKLVYLSAIY